MYLCVDFDGTVVDHVFPKIGEPAPGAIKWLRRFNALGAKIILWTMRADGGQHGAVLSDAVSFLERNAVALFGVNENPTQRTWTSSPKAYGHIYIDDAAFGCPMVQPEGFSRPCADWSIVGPAIEKILLDSRGS